MHIGAVEAALSLGKVHVELAAVEGESSGPAALLDEPLSGGASHQANAVGSVSRDEGKGDARCKEYVQGLGVNVGIELGSV